MCPLLFNLSHTHTHKHCIVIHSNPLDHRRSAVYKSKLKGWLIDSHTKDQNGYERMGQDRRWGRRDEEEGMRRKGLMEKKQRMRRRAAAVNPSL